MGGVRDFRALSSYIRLVRALPGTARIVNLVEGRTSRSGSRKRRPNKARKHGPRLRGAAQVAFYHAFGIWVTQKT